MAKRDLMPAVKNADGRRRFQGKTVLVSGGAGGMGRAASVMFAAEGARVGILDILDKQGKEVEQEIIAAGGSALFVKTDAAKAAQVRAGIAKVNRKFGPINVLFNHAGTVTVRPFHETTE